MAPPSMEPPLWTLFRSLRRKACQGRMGPDAPPNQRTHPDDPCLRATKCPDVVLTKTQQFKVGVFVALASRRSRMARDAPCRASAEQSGYITDEVRIGVEW